MRNKEEMTHLHEETIKAFGQVDVIIHNALINFQFDPTKQLDLAHISWENYLTQLEGSVQGALNLLQTNLESLKKIRKSSLHRYRYKPLPKPCRSLP